MITNAGIDPRIIIKVTWKRVAWLFLVSTAAVLLYQFFEQNVVIPNTSISIFGTVLAILLGFRVNNAYGRWWEARKLWGTIVNRSRSVTRQILHYIPDLTPEVHKQLVYRQVAYCYALSHHLRKKPIRDVIAPYLNADEVEEFLKRSNVPNAIIERQTQHIAELTRAGTLSEFQQRQIEEHLTTLIDSQGGCERIKNTVFPHDYKLYTTMFVNVFSIALPFVIVDDAGWQAVAWTVFLGFALGAIDHLARAIEMPFEDRVNDTPMTAISRVIEIDLREMISDVDIPEPKQPVGGVLK